MRILVTSVVDLHRVGRNRIHVFVERLQRSHTVRVNSLDAWWLGDVSGQGDNAGSVSPVTGTADVFHLSGPRLAPFLQEAASLPRLARWLRMPEGHSFDVHINYSSLVCGLYAARALTRKGIPTVFDLSDDLPVAFGMTPAVPSALRPVARLASMVLLKLNIATSAHVTAVSQALSAKYSLQRPKATVLPNGVDTNVFRPQPAVALRRKLGFGPGDVVVGYVGVLREWVDLSSLFQAIKRLSEGQRRYKLLIVGGGVTLSRNRQLAEEHRLTGSVVFTEAVPYGQVPGYMCCMDIATIPFTGDDLASNASPIKLFEYMACERPVVSSALRGVHEAVGDRVLYARTPEEWAASLASLGENPSRRRLLGEEGRRHVSANFTWDAVCSRLETLLMTLSGRRAEAGT